jgi:hypothetical protein
MRSGFGTVIALLLENRGCGSSNVNSLDEGERIEIVEVRELAELAKSLIKRTKPYVGAIEVGPNEGCSI